MDTGPAKLGTPYSRRLDGRSKNIFEKTKNSCAWGLFLDQNRFNVEDVRARWKDRRIHGAVHD